MIHLKKICFVVLMIIAFIGCTEVYIPEINTDTQALVVEGLVTDGAGPFTIHLSKSMALSSGSVGGYSYVSDAKLTISDNENNIFILTNPGFGNYITPVTFKAKVGNVYKLHIETSDGNVYESNPQKLLLPETYDSIRGYYSTDKYLDSENQLLDAVGADVRIDLFSKAINHELPVCRFNSNVTVQYVYTMNDIDSKTNQPITDWYWFRFGYSSYNLDETVNITEQKFTTNSTAIKNHSLAFIPFGTGNYGLPTPPTTSLIYYLRVNQYTMNDDSYRFYKGANNQLAGNGKIFDPITSQLYGNVKCVNNPSKIALGLFEVSSVTQAAFVVNGTSWNKQVTVKKVAYLDIPRTLFKEYKIWNALPPSPAKDSLDYIPIPLPTWWFHN